ncbi:unnamed protein product [Caretta caretta]
MGLALREPELRLVLLAYADDVLLMVQDPGDLARVEACQAIYSAASSAWVNWVKSSGLVPLVLNNLKRTVIECRYRFSGLAVRAFYSPYAHMAGIDFNRSYKHLGRGQ